MLDALKQSNEPEHLVLAATRYLRGLKGNLVQLKKIKAAKEHTAKEETAAAASQQSQQQQAYGVQQQSYGGQMPACGGQLPPPLATGPGFHTTSERMG